MGDLAALLLRSQHSLQLVLGAVILPEGALLQPVALLGDRDGGEWWPPRWRLTGPARLAVIGAGGLDILNES